MDLSLPSSGPEGRQLDGVLERRTEVDGAGKPATVCGIL